MADSPKFRKTKRLISWMQLTGARGRLPRDREEVFFKEHAAGTLDAQMVASYSAWAGRVPEMEFMLRGDGKAIIRYAQNLRQNFGIAVDVIDELRDTILSDADLLEWARKFGRLPPHLEERINEPAIAVTYSDYVVRGRLPVEMENRVFSTQSALNVFNYIKIHHLGLVEGHLKECLVGSTTAIVEYMKYLRSYGLKLPNDLRDCLAGDNGSMLAWSRIYGRLPSHLEETLSDPPVCLDYAVSVLHGRLPLSAEACLLNDHKVAVDYAFKVIRGFAPCRLPEEIHASIIMKSFEFTDDPQIKRYVAACDSDPNRMGNK